MWVKPFAPTRRSKEYISHINVFCLHIKVFRRQILSLNYKYVSKILYYVSFCICLYPYGRVNCTLMHGFALESILKGI